MSAIQLQILQYLISALPTIYNYYNYYNSYSKYIPSSSLFFSNKSAGNDFNFYGDYEKELENIQMDKLLKWMSMIFEDDISKLLKIKIDEKDENKEDENKEKEEKLKAYKKELYNIYVTIKSDYSQYLERKRYNSKIWLLSSYRQKNTKELSKKIILDIQLFYEGLKMFSLFEKIN